jgi:C-terminal processing protease CtpA/Prc
VQQQQAKPLAARTTILVVPSVKLGIILDTQEGQGPIVHRVLSESPLKGKVFEGDVICSINGVDMRGLNAAHITNVMIENADNERQLVVERYDVRREQLDSPAIGRQWETRLHSGQLHRILNWPQAATPVVVAKTIP